MKTIIIIQANVSNPIILLPFGKMQLCSISYTKLGCKISPCCINLMQCIPYLVAVLVVMMLCMCFPRMYTFIKPDTRIDLMIQIYIACYTNIMTTIHCYFDKTMLIYRYTQIRSHTLK